MTPAAKPVKARRTIRSSPFFKKNTHPAPNAVPTNGRSSSANTCFVISGRSPSFLEDQYNDPVLCPSIWSRAPVNPLFANLKIIPCMERIGGASACGAPPVVYQKSGIATFLTVYSLVKVRFARPFGQPGVLAGTWPGFDLLQCLQTRRWSSLKLGGGNRGKLLRKGQRGGDFFDACKSLDGMEAFFHLPPEHVKSGGFHL